MTQLWIRFAVALLALGGIVVGYIFSPLAAATGWHIAFVYGAGIVLGSLALGLINAVTGGEWYGAIAPASTALARVVPFLIVAIWPVWASAGLLFHWNDARPPVADLWLNLPGMIARTLVLLVALSMLSLWLRRIRSSPVSAALGLVLYAFAVSIFGVDWVQAIRAGTILTDFGPFLAVQQIALALTFAILVLPPIPARLGDDLANILIALLVGSFYLALMDFIVTWYADVPSRVTWYAQRATGQWPRLLDAAIFFGVFLPLAILLASRTHFVRSHLKFASASVLLGGAVYDAWLMGVDAGFLTLVFAAAGVLLLATLSIGLVRMAARNGVPA